MKRSEKILRKNNISRAISDNERTAIENNVLIKHVIDNDIKHLWWLIRLILAVVLGLLVKAFY